MIQKLQFLTPIPKIPKIYPKEKTFTILFIAALFRINKIWKQSMYLTTDDWTKGSMVHINYRILLSYKKR